MDDIQILSGKKILVVDDDELIRRMFKTQMGKSGAMVIEATDGEAALRLVKSEHVDYIMLDLVMPNMDGCEESRR
jgi:CheY-like chemotaxis protein